MELDFNSVEMSRKPNAEASSLASAEVPLTFNSVETIPNLNASAAFFSHSLEQLKGQVDSVKVFKEGVDTGDILFDKVTFCGIVKPRDPEIPDGRASILES